jgi:hypothetical protein
MPDTDTVTVIAGFNRRPANEFKFSISTILYIYINNFTGPFPDCIVEPDFPRLLHAYRMKTCDPCNRRSKRPLSFDAPTTAGCRNRRKATAPSMNPSSIPTTPQGDMKASHAAGNRRPSLRGPLSLWSYRVTRWVLAAVFTGSGIAKLADPGAFAVVIDAYGLLPQPLIGLAALGLPVLELVAGIGLVFDTRGSLGLSAALTLLFAGILGYGIHMGLDVDCGCFGPPDPAGEAFHGLRAALVRDLLLLAAVAYLYAIRGVQGSARAAAEKWEATTDDSAL